MENSRRPILYKGEIYSKPIIKKSGPSPEPAESFEDARKRMIIDIDRATQELNSVRNELRMPNEFVLCLRLQSEFSAKSYYPATLFDLDYTGSDMQEIGSRIWRGETYLSDDVVESTKTGLGKLLFVRTTERGLNKFKETLNRTANSPKFQIDVRKVMSINLLSPQEQILGFSPNWESGRVEAVIHPLSLDKEIAFERFKQISESAGADLKTLRYKQYGEGITFISIVANTKIVEALSGYNPLRTMHPLLVRELPDMTRVAPIKGMPKPPEFKGKPKTTLGIIDGGYKSGNIYLDNYVEIVEPISAPAFEAGLQHGTHVSSAALYGPINAYKNTDQLPEPSISVKNFRVLSQTSGLDPELYNAIDEIEKIIPANQDISVYNLSFGPSGEILDDHISRFTFACDLLSWEYGVLFCAAVGNDGETEGGDRIQSPSDLVNGLGVGAFTISDGKKEHAPYSSKGPGREGNKLKPDLVGFGGCERFPTQLLTYNEGYRSYMWGTSFSSPIVASTAAQLIGGSENEVTSLVARGLIIHSTIERSELPHSNSMGHGALPDDISHIVSCADKSYTLIYEGEVTPAKYVEYTIPWVNGLIDKGKAVFRWTTVVLTHIDVSSPDDYTSTSIETSFYPNSRKFNFSKAINGKNTTKTLDIYLNQTEVNALLSDGWKQGGFPASSSGPKPFEKEADLRSSLKWDSVDYRVKSSLAKNIKAPVFHVHTLQRGTRNQNEKVRFAIILTIDTPKSEVDLYARIIAAYPNLAQLKVDVKATVSIHG